MRAFALLVGVTAIVAGCDDGPAAGQLEVTVAGTAAVEDGFTSDDGWAISFSRFEVDVGDLTAQSGHEVAELYDPAFARFDLVEPAGEGHPVTVLEAPGGDYDHRGFTLRDFSIAGSATRDATAISFDWQVTVTVLHGHCTGRVTVDGDTQPFPITVLGEHVFDVDAVARDSSSSFDALAAADSADGSAADGVVTSAELAAVATASQNAYQAGNRDLPDLWTFIAYQTAHVGGLDGDRGCGNVVVLD